MEFWQAMVLAVVEGVTEFLPVSSTGHMIIVSSWMGIEHDPMTKLYTVAVQMGAILSVLVLYWRRFLSSWSFYQKLFIAVLPAAVIGLLFEKKIDALLGDVRVVAGALIVGGILLILLERGLLAKRPNTVELAEMSYRTSFLVGLTQCLAFIPGTSRSAASILGGLYFGLTRQTAAEFSFFLAVPTLAGATLLKLVKAPELLDAEHLKILVIGNVVSFVVAWIAIRSFVRYVSSHGFTAFGIYRIILGVLIFLK